MKIGSFLLVFSSILMFRPTLVMAVVHYKCRGGLYPRSNIKRFPVPEDKIQWCTEYAEYNPPNYTSPTVYGKVWADPEIGEEKFKPKWNSLDGNVDRSSYVGNYSVEKGYPLNPIGRTGIAGRGVLGRWGPNHAADPVVTRWKKLPSGIVETDSNEKAILQVVVIKRGDTGEWALPGGMVDPGERVATAAVREFQEEATNALQMSDDKKQYWKLKFEQFFSGGDEIFKGYIDDHRNTDNAWIESAAYNFHDEKGDVVGSLKLHAGDDAVGVRWVDVTPDLDLYASHKQIVNEVRKKLLQEENYN